MARVARPFVDVIGGSNHAGYWELHLVEVCWFLRRFAAFSGSVFIALTFLVLCSRFQGQDMDVEFIQTLQQQCKRFISERGTATVQEIQQFIQNSVQPAAPTSSV